MKSVFLSALIVLTGAPVIASETTTYNTMCVVSLDKVPEPQMCQVVENRNNNGTLNWRNIYARNYWVKSWFDNTGFMTKDSIRKYPYKWEYRANRQGYSQVSPNLNVHNVSWD